MSTPPEKKPLTARQKKAVVLLLAKNFTETAREIGICRNTLQKWVESPQFQAELASARNQLFESSLDSIKANFQRAVDCLVNLLGSDREEIVLRSATTIVEHCLRIRQLEGIEQRLAEIERNLE